MTEPEASAPAVMRNYHEVLRNDLSKVLSPLAEAGDLAGFSAAWAAYTGAIAVLGNTVGCAAGVCPLERRVRALDQQGMNTSPFDIAVKGSPPRQAQRCNWIPPRRLHLLDDRIASCFRESRRTVLRKYDRRRIYRNWRDRLHYVQILFCSTPHNF